MAMRAQEQFKIAGSLYGLLIGDALGVPYEFHAADQIPHKSLIELEPPPNFDRSHAGVPAGTWSDDGAQALILLHTLLACEHFDARHFADGLVDWYDLGFMAVDNRVFDVGFQTSAAINDLRRGADPDASGGAGERDNGNGSLMRVAPLALWHVGSDAALIKDAFAQSRVTHAHMRSQLCCALCCLWMRRMLQGLEAEFAWDEALKTLREHFPAGAIRDEFEQNIAPYAEREAHGSGYVVDCLFSARFALLESTSYEDAVKCAIALGRDTDTTACVAGALAGLRGGVNEIPQRWLNALRGRDIVDPLVEKLSALQLNHRTIQ